MLLLTNPKIFQAECTDYDKGKKTWQSVWLLNTFFPNLTEILWQRDWLPTHFFVQDLCLLQKKSSRMQYFRGKAISRNSFPLKKIWENSSVLGRSQTPYTFLSSKYPQLPPKFTLSSFNHGTATVNKRQGLVCIFTKLVKMQHHRAIYLLDEYASVSMEITCTKAYKCRW